MNKKTLLRAALIAAVVTPATVMASGYKLNEQSAAGMGTAHAGRAAMAEDASVVFYNPAAMTELDRAQITGGFTYISGDGEFTGDAEDVQGSLITGAADNDAYSNGGDFLGEAFIPFFYYVRPINDKISVGLGIYAPFGTNTDYNDTFVGGGFADETSLTSLEIQPSIAYKINDQLSIGVGLDIVYVEGLLSKQVDAVPYSATAAAGYKATYEGNIAGGATDAQATAAAEAAVGGLTADSPLLNDGFENHFEVSGDDWGYGFNLGAFYKLSDATTLGLTYRSEIEITLEGDSTFDKEFVYYNAGTSSVESFGNVRPQASEVPITTPASATFAVTHQVTDKLLLQAGTTWTGWSSFKSFDIIATENTADVTAADISDISKLGDGYIGHIDESWTDVWAVALGGTYQLNNNLALRAGYAYDQSPVDDEHRTARVPSSDRQWLTLGAGYVVDQNLSIDVAAGYLFMYAMDVNEVNKEVDNTTKGDASLTGEYEIDVFALSAQVNYKF
jgi:long-chain fatty acid transport protein